MSGPTTWRDVRREAIASLGLLGAHDPETGECRAQSLRRYQDEPGGYYGDHWVSCACVRYTGPQPVEQYWVPPAADMNIVTAPRQMEP